MNCIKCEKEIPQERVDCFRDKECTTCVRCSEEQPVEGVMIFTHKTGGYLQIVPDRQTAHYFYRMRKRATFNAQLPFSPKESTNPGKFSRTTSADSALKGKQ